MPCLGWFAPVVVFLEVVGVDERLVVAVDLDVVAVPPTPDVVVLSPGTVVPPASVVVVTSSEVDVVAPALLLFLPPPPHAAAIMPADTTATSTESRRRPDGRRGRPAAVPNSLGILFPPRRHPLLLINRSVAISGS